MKYDIISKKELLSMFNLEYFANDNYKVLKFLYNNQIQVKDEYYIVLSQQEIADMVQFSKLKTNGIMQVLLLIMKIKEENMS